MGTASRVEHKLMPRNLHPAAPRVPATATAPSEKRRESGGPLPYDDRTLSLSSGGPRWPQATARAAAGRGGAGAAEKQAEALTTARRGASRWLLSLLNS